MNDKPSFNFGELASVVGEYYREEYGYTPAVEALDEWLTAEKREAHLEALEGVLFSLHTREDFMEDFANESEDFRKGFRAARLWARRHRDDLEILYEKEK